MAQMITDYKIFLMEARQAVDELDSYRDSEINLKLEEKKQERTLEAEKKAVNDSINITIKKRLDQISSSYDQEISRGQERLKKVRGKREKAKNQGVKGRIAEETKELYQHNKDLRINMRVLFQEKQVPHFCSSNFYYSLFYTRGFSELLVLLITLCVCFLAIPNAVYMLLPDNKPIYLAAVYFITVILFGGLYIAISNRTKMRYFDSLKEGRSIKNTIASNNKKIRMITKTIQRDKNETVYDLEQFDDEITRIELELSEVTKKKKEALSTFEAVTKTILADEITENSRERMMQLQSDYDKITENIKTMEEKIKEKVLYIADNYEVYLEKSYLKPDKLSELSSLIESGQAKNLTDAVELIKSR